MSETPVMKQENPMPVTSAAPMAPMTPETKPAQPAKQKKIPMVAIVILATVGIGLILAGIYYFWNTNYNSSGNPAYGNNNNYGNQPTPTATNTAQTEETLPTSGRIFYTMGEEQDIYMLDITTMSPEKLTTSTSPNNKQVHVISGDMLGYTTCLYTVNDFSCEFHTLSLPDKTDAKVYSPDPKQLVTSTGWYLPNIFAYNTTLYVPKETEALVLNNKGSIKQLEGLTGERLGRGGFEGDTQKAIFSADGKYVLKINTASLRAAVDDNIYVFDLEKDSKITIPKATHPLWRNTSSIIYSSVTAGRTTKFFVYDLTTSTETEFDTGKVISGGFTLMSDKILYKSDDKAIYLYNLTSKENKKVLDNGRDPLWVNNDNFVYRETKNCSGAEEGCEIVDYKVSGVKIYNIASGATKVVTTDVNKFGQYYTSFSK